MNKSRRGFLKSALGLAVAQAFLPRTSSPSTDDVLWPNVSFHYVGTVTGRLSSSGPNIQDLHWDRSRLKDSTFLSNYSVIEDRVLSQIAGYRYVVQHMNDYLNGVRELDQGFRLIQSDYHPIDMLKPFERGEE